MIADPPSRRPAAGFITSRLPPVLRKLGIRSRLLLLVLALLLPFLGYLVFSAHRDAEQEREHVGRQVLAVAQLTAGRLDDHINNIYQLLATLGHTMSANASDAVRNDAALLTLRPELPKELSDISVWTREGDNIGSIDPGWRLGLDNASQRRFFHDALRSEGLSVEAPSVSPSTGELVAVFAMPLWERGQIVGIVSAAMRLLDLQTRLDPKTDLPPGAVITVRDARGVVLARSLDAAKWIGRTVGQPARAGSDAEEGKVVRGPSADGQERLAGLVTASTVPWNVYVGIPTAIALAPVDARLRRDLGAAAIVLFVGLLLAAAVAHGISAPLQQLSIDAAALGAGDLAHRSQVDAAGESGVLAATLNRMAEAVQERNAALQQSEERLRQVTDNMPALVSYLDLDLRFRFANRTYLDWLGSDPRKLIGCSLVDLYGAEVVARIQPHFDTARRGERVTYERELPTLGGMRHVDVMLMPHRAADDSVQGFYVLMLDITARREAEAQLRMLAQYDSLTGLPNRALFNDRLRVAIARSQRSPGHLALLFVDVDHFKPVNDTHGHAAGDELLRVLAQRLHASVRASDTVARLGGDEFVVLLEGLSASEDAMMMATRIVDSVRQPVSLPTAVVHVSASIGVALRGPADAGDYEGLALLQRADAALYRAKHAGRDGWRGDAGVDSLIAANSLHV